MLLRVWVDSFDGSTVYSLLQFLDALHGGAGDTHDGRDTRIARLVVKILDFLPVELLCIGHLLNRDLVQMCSNYYHWRVGGTCLHV